MSALAGARPAKVAPRFAYVSAALIVAAAVGLAALGITAGATLSGSSSGDSVGVATSSSDSTGSTADDTTGGGEGTAADSDRDEAAAAERRALRRYEEELDPILDSCAFLVAQGMRPGVTDIAQGAFDDATLVTMASGWVDSTEELRERFEAVDPPAFLSEHAERLDEALGAYVQVARALRDAAEATGEQRQKLVAEVAPLGERADDLYDEARMILEEHRSRLGIDASSPDRGMS